MEETFYSNTYSRKQKENYYRPQQRTNRSLRLTTVIMISFSNLYSFLTKLEYSYTVSSLLNLNAVKNRLFCTCKVFAQTFENVFVIFFLFADLQHLPASIIAPGERCLLYRSVFARWLASFIVFLPVPFSCKANNPQTER